MRTHFLHPTPLLFLAVDIALLIGCLLLGIALRDATGGSVDVLAHVRLVSMVIFFPPLFAALGLYPGVMLSPPEELKKLSWAISMIFFGLLGLIFFVKGAEQYSRVAMVAAWGLALVALPLGRAAVRWLFGRRPWWGYPLAVLGNGPAAQHMLKILWRHPRLGLRPVAALSTSDCLPDLDLPVVPLDRADELLASHPDLYILVFQVCFSNAELEMAMQHLERSFRRVIIVPSFGSNSSLWVSALDLGGNIGLLVRQNLLDPGRLRMKRCMDLLLTLCLGTLLLPFLGAICLAIRLESPGPMFFRQRRLGQGGKDIVIYKFRTMVLDAEARLAACLCKPELRAEWDRTCKLKRDPRITRVGRLLRCTSLDELPQLWNVLRGDMSLVGPRPIVTAEIPRYRETWDYYQRVKPGLTGLWQISGRNALSYEERVALDRYYICNWSVWFDIYILVRTIPVVVNGTGAY